MRTKLNAASFTIGCLLSLQLFAAEASPYTGQEGREIKALSAVDVSALLAGKGMGYAKAAELNGYPGPAHVLELAEELALTSAQRAQSKIIFDQMEVSAQDLGAQLVAAERELDLKFKEKKIDERSLTKLVSNVGRLESQLREVHLRAHLHQIELLSDQQVAEYNMLRGYGNGGHGSHQHHRE